MAKMAPCTGCRCVRTGARRSAALQVVSRQSSAASLMVWMCVNAMWMRMVGSSLKQAALAGATSNAGHFFGSYD